jgi:hypothetical protein
VVPEVLVGVRVIALHANKAAPIAIESADSQPNPTTQANRDRRRGDGSSQMVPTEEEHPVRTEVADRAHSKAADCYAERTLASRIISIDGSIVRL